MHNTIVAKLHNDSCLGDENVSIVSLLQNDALCNKGELNLYMFRRQDMRVLHGCLINIWNIRASFVKTETSYV